MSNNNVFALEDVVINPNSVGEPKNMYDDIQYTSSRDIDIAINIDEDVLANYDPLFKICEIIPGSTIDQTREQEKCSTYSSEQGIKKFQLSGRGDGEKTIKITFSYVSGGLSGTYTETKKIVLDTTGPVIDLTGGEYVYLLQGETYSELGATCTDDSGVNLEACTVEIGEANIDMNKKGYQYIRYRAEDFLGNEVNVNRKVVVEIPEEKSSGVYYWVAAGIGIALLAAFLFIKVFQNKEKQKNQSSVL